MIRAINVFRQHARDTGRPVHVDRLARDARFSSQVPLHPLSFDPKLYSPKEFQVFVCSFHNVISIKSALYWIVQPELSAKMFVFIFSRYYYYVRLVIFYSKFCIPVPYGKRSKECFTIPLDDKD